MKSFEITPQIILSDKGLIKLSEGITNLKSLQKLKLNLRYYFGFFNLNE